MNTRQKNLFSNIPDEYITVLTNDERDAVKKIIDHQPPLDVHQMDNDNFFLQMELAKRDIPRELASKLINFRKNPNDYGTLLIRNLPTDPILPTTPKDGRSSPDKTSYVSEYNLLLLLMYLGEPIAYVDRKDGDIIHNICPIQGSEEVQGNAGSVLFDFHTDATVHPHKNDWFGLFCLRPDHDQIAQIFTASIRKALPRLPSNVISLLREPLYRIRHTSKETSVVLYSRLVPILSHDILDPDLSIDCYYMEGISSDAQLALNILKSVLAEVAIGAKLLPGDLIIIDNRMAAHGRTAFKPRYDGNDRWLQRLYTIRDFHRSKISRLPGSHVCMPFNEFSIENTV